MKKKYIILTISLIIYSLCILGYSSVVEIWDGGNDYKGYKNKFNWSLYPFFWIPVVLLFKTTWHEFHASWKELFRNKIIISKKNTDTTELYNVFLDYTKNQRNNYLSRKHLFVYSLILATIAMWFDTKELRKLYSYNNVKSVKIYPIYKDPENKNILKHYVLSKPKKDHSEPIQLSEKEDGKRIIDASWTAARIFKGIQYKNTNRIFILFAYLQQYIIIFLGFCSLLQIWFHLYYFARFNKLPISKQLDMKLELDYKSNLHEFGLERWNHALNTIYWVIALSLIVPIISKNSQTENNINDTGQILIRWIVPLLFLSPMIFTIIARQKKVVDIWEKLRSETDENVDKFHKQVLWPLNKNWASKLGIVLSFILLSYLIGDILKSLGVDKLI